MNRILKRLGICSAIVALSGFLLMVSSFAVIVAAIGGSSSNYNTSINSSLGNGLTGNEAIICEFFRDKGVSDIHIAAILGNMYQESHIDPNCVESNGEGIGLTQLSFGRKTQFLEYAAFYGTPWTDINIQLNFTWLEFDYDANSRCGGVADYQWIYKTGDYTKEKFDSAKTVEEATTVFCHGFERCNKDESISMLQSVRIPKALEYYNAMKGPGGFGGSTGEAANISLDQRMSWLFPNGVPTSESAIQPFLVTISVPINDASGNKTTRSLTVHRALQQEIMEIFVEMQREGFKINQLACYGYRKMASGTGSLSHHSYGVAIDINWDANPAVYWGAKPDPSSQYYINSRIVQIWKKHGFYWGGDWSASYYDPMHFTYTNH
jgi:hypothetical protein